MTDGDQPQQPDESPTPEFEIEEIELDPAEIDRYASAIVRIHNRGHEPGSDALTRASNTYGTAFQFLVFRRGAPYALLLADAAEAEALRRLEHHPVAVELVRGPIAEIHARVCRETDRLPDPATAESAPDGNDQAPG